MASDDYEAQRLEIIARNRARLQQLGLLDAADKFSAATAKARKPKAARAPKKPPGQPTRHSRRQGGEAPAELNDEEQQLAAMYVDGVCPKCGKAFEKGIKQHFDKCTGAPRRSRRSADADVTGEIVGEEEDQHEEADQDVRKLPPMDPAKLAGKLKELELSGLIDFSADKAEFAVLGSTGNKYVVTLSDDKHSCKCMDFRIRRRECKHIKLVLQQLGVAKHPEDWHQAVDRQLDAAVKAEGDGSGGATDVVERETDAAAPTGFSGHDKAEAEDAKPSKVRSVKREGRKGKPAAAAKRRKAAVKAEPKVSVKTEGAVGAAGKGADKTEPGTRRLPRSLQ